MAVGVGAFGPMYKVTVRGVADGSGQRRRRSSAERRGSTIPAGALCVEVAKAAPSGEAVQQMLAGERQAAATSGPAG